MLCARWRSAHIHSLSSHLLSLACTSHRCVWMWMWMCQSPFRSCFYCTFNVPKVYYIQLKQHKFFIEKMRYLVHGGEKAHRSSRNRSLSSSYVSYLHCSAFYFSSVEFQSGFVGFIHFLSTLSITSHFIFCTHWTHTILLGVCFIRSLLLYCVKLVFVNVGVCLWFCCHFIIPNRH